MIYSFYQIAHMSKKAAASKPDPLRKISFPVTEEEYQMICKKCANQKPVKKPGPFCKEVILKHVC